MNFRAKRLEAFLNGPHRPGQFMTFKVEPITPGDADGESLVITRREPHPVDGSPINQTKIRIAAEEFQEVPGDGDARLVIEELSK